MFSHTPEFVVMLKKLHRSPQKCHATIKQKSVVRCSRAVSGPVMCITKVYVLQNGVAEATTDFSQNKSSFFLKLLRIMEQTTC